MGIVGNVGEVVVEYVGWVGLGLWDDGVCGVCCGVVEDDIVFLVLEIFIDFWKIDYNGYFEFF